VIEHEIRVMDKEAIDLELNDKHPNYHDDVSTSPSNHTYNNDLVLRNTGGRIDVGINHRNSYEFENSAGLLAIMIAHNIRQRYLPSVSRSNYSV
jgi:hypothetical protein